MTSRLRAWAGQGRASYAEGARYTPRSSMPRCHRPNFSRSAFSASSKHVTGPSVKKKPNMPAARAGRASEPHLWAPVTVLYTLLHTPDTLQRLVMAGRRWRGPQGVLHTGRQGMMQPCAPDASPRLHRHGPHLITRGQAATSHQKTSRQTRGAARRRCRRGSATRSAARPRTPRVLGHGGRRCGAPEMCPPHSACPAARPASSRPLMRRPVTASRCSYAPGRPRISSVLMPATIASGLPDSVPAWYIGPARRALLGRHAHRALSARRRRWRRRAPSGRWQRCPLAASGAAASPLTPRTAVPPAPPQPRRSPEPGPAAGLAGPGCDPT